MVGQHTDRKALHAAASAGEGDSLADILDQLLSGDASAKAPARAEPEQAGSAPGVATFLALW